MLLSLFGCTNEDDDNSNGTHKAYCGVVKNGDEYAVHHHPYSLVNNESGQDINEHYCTSHMFKIYQYADDILTFNTEIRKGDSDELHHYINLALQHGYDTKEVNGFSLLGEATSDFSNQDEFGWSTVDNNIVLETNIGEQTLYQSITVDEQGALQFEYRSSDGQQGRYNISEEEALLFFYGGESALETMETFDYFSSLF
ncbi:hypothetical protein L1D19_21975 [Vibrio natriegens]|uniref:hypothetical protein n=1 Tax=Vibrio natriegens TaxID=691 RepID=UPI001EFE090E|nr:hypothetical protein [Vibrio natriegens]MCG9702738.1 hypothetical protein [Vibrio natriegens]